MSDNANTNNAAYGGSPGMACSGSWNVYRTHGRLVKITYDIGCKDAEEYAGKLRKEGWKAWSLEVNGTRVTDVMHLPYTNPARATDARITKVDKTAGRGCQQCPCSASSNRRQHENHES